MFRPLFERVPLAHHKSAEKRARQAIKRQARNKSVLRRTRTVVKGLREAIAAGDPAKAGEALRVAERELRKAASKGVLPKRRADRNVSRLSKAVRKLSPA
jgi:small subunit ribosomal protein S20